MEFIHVLPSIFWLTLLIVACGGMIIGMFIGCVISHKAAVEVARKFIKRGYV